MALQTIVPNPNDYSAPLDQNSSAMYDPMQMGTLKPQLTGQLPSLYKPEEKPTMPSLGSLPSMAPTLRPMVNNPVNDLAQKPAISPLTGGFWHKLGQVASRVGQAGAATFIPGAAMAESMIPGSMLYNINQHQEAQQEMERVKREGIEQQNTASEQALRASQISAEQEREDQEKAALEKMVPIKDARENIIGFQSGRGRFMSLDDPNLPPEAKAIAAAAQPKQATSPTELFLQQNPHATAQELQNWLAKPLPQDQADVMNKTWNPILSKSGLPADQFHSGMTSAEASALSSAINNSIGKQQGAQKISVSIRGQDMANQRSAMTANRQEITTHDRQYVLPAENVEKSYQMMNQSYNDYENARKQGKTLPSGAQSMLALSQHLVTTFGNVKGSRVTKDMIQEHLHARSIGDDALVAVQKLTNGDQLSPAQWDAFHNLLQQSRNLSWTTAAKEAARKKIPIDFMPKDLETVTKNGVQYTIGDDGNYHAGGQ